MADSKEWIVRFYANHDSIPEGHHDGEIVRELVYCKDCKWNKEIRWVDCFMSGMYGRIPDRNFCSNGKRRTENG